MSQESRDASLKATTRDLGGNKRWRRSGRVRGGGGGNWRDGEKEEDGTLRMSE